MPEFDDLLTEFGLEDELKHYGVKGMKWGVRKKRPTATTTVKAPNGNRVTVKYNPDKAKVDGGPTRKAVVETSSRLERRRIQRQLDNAPSSDAKKVEKLKTNARKGGAKTLSDDQLQKVIKRLEQEKKLDQLLPPKGAEAAGKAVTKILQEVGKEQFRNVARDQAALAVKKALKK